MKYVTYNPTDALADIVRQYWSLEGHAPEGQEYIHRTMAHFCPELIFHYGGRFSELTAESNIKMAFEAGIHGQTDRIRRFIAKDRYGIFGVILQPYVIPLIAGVSSSEVCNQLIDLPSVFGSGGWRLAEQILNASEDPERIQFVNKFLLKRLKAYKRPEIIHAARQVCIQKGKVDVKDMAAQAFLSQRQFERKFKELVGFDPKKFVRLVRFKSLATHYCRTDKSLTQIAYEYGYYDQSHFIQEFKSFSGYRPNVFFSGGAHEIFYAPSAK